jgi:hypothetical protein
MGQPQAASGNTAGRHVCVEEGRGEGSKISFVAFEVLGNQQVMDK